MNEKTLTQQHTSDNDFLVGDVVVFDEKLSRDDLLTVDAVLDGGRYLGLSDYRYALPVDRVRHATAEEIQASKRLATIQSMGDDAHIENHVSPLCITDSTNHIESCYIDKKKQVELLQTEVARLNQKCERQAAEMVAMQVQIDELTAENGQLHKAATAHFRNQNHYMDLYHGLVEQLYPYALDLGEPTILLESEKSRFPKEYVDGYNRARECVHHTLMEMMQGDEEYICMQCDMLGDEA